MPRKTEEQILRHLERSRSLKQRRSKVAVDVEGKQMLAENAVLVDGVPYCVTSAKYKCLPDLVTDGGRVQKTRRVEGLVLLFEKRTTKEREYWSDKLNAVWDALNNCYIPRTSAAVYYPRPYVEKHVFSSDWSGQFDVDLKNERELWRDGNGRFYASLEVAEKMNLVKDPAHPSHKRLKKNVQTGVEDSSVVSSQICYGYHSQKRDFRFKADRERFTIGFEVEKEDARQLKNFNAKHTLLQKSGWCLERDGSLSSNGGYELVSPILPMMKTNLLIRSLKHVEKFVNGQGSDRCGGHIHVKDQQRDNIRLWDEISGYFPLLYALYPERTVNRYCQAMKADKMRGAGNSHSIAVSFSRRGTIEFRLFPTPSNVATIIWRARLIQIFMLYKCRNVHQLRAMMADTSSQLYKHLRLVYKPKEYVELSHLVQLMAKKYEKVKIKPIKQRELKGAFRRERTFASKYLKEQTFTK